ncbi:MAG: nicotinate phosphoribosyltransferase [Oscillospiraceae bacterium]|jgi:nicotinate phosphoribosyltransferase|nr:nicotinate phosphoribosyltransferase [Oscillospiraceae bacterium]
MSVNLTSETNLTMLADFYELTMSNGYLQNGMADKVVVFDLFFRRIPDNGGFAIAAGLEQAVEYMRGLNFSGEDIEYLRSQKLFGKDFLKYLENFKFTCDVWAIPEGTPVFPNEPLVVVKGPIIQAQMLETMLLVTINHQSLIATKTSRIVRAAAGKNVFEFGARRAHGYSAAVYGARAAYIAGCASTSCTLSGLKFDIPVSGTMAHSWVQSFDTELEAFKTYAKIYPNSCVLLIDTYNVINSGVPNAIKTFDEVLKPLGRRPRAVRIDSGDIAYLSKKTRKMLDEAGYPDVQIVASNSLDEYIIRDLLLQQAKVDSFGVGENLITSKSNPVFGGVYKLVAVEKSGDYIPKIKISETVEKITTPGFKSLYRFYSKDSGAAQADLIALYNEKINVSNGFTIFDPVNTWKKKALENITARPLYVRVFDKGRLACKLPSLEEIKNYCALEVASLWEEVKRFEFPHKYYVDLSQGLWDLKYSTLSHNGRRA